MAQTGNRVRSAHQRALSRRAAQGTIAALLLVSSLGCSGGGGGTPSPPTPSPGSVGGHPATPTTTPPPTVTPTPTTAPFTLIWSDEFDGAAGSKVDSNNWLYDIGTGYPGGAANWGTGEIEEMTDDLANVYQDGLGHLAMKPIRGDSVHEWTSGGIETQRSDFQPPPGGALAIEASIQQPNVTGDAAAGYWAAFWSLGAPFRGNYGNWPGIGEIDILEDINGRSSLFGTFHCGTVDPPNPCHEFSGLGSGETACPECQTAFHTYRAELDLGAMPPEIRWYRDGIHYFTVRSDEVDPTTWKDATDHGYFLILNVAIGGGFPDAFGGGPTRDTVSGIPMLIDYVRVFTR
jgi:beta-glucanase (GH16 family)